MSEFRSMAFWGSIDLERKITQVAETEGWSFSRAVRELLMEALLSRVQDSAKPFRSHDWPEERK